MNQETFEALRGSIAKWYKIEQGNGKDLGTTNCPLCRLFLKDLCRGCPVSESTGATHCIGSPYPAFAEQMREAWQCYGGMEPTSIDECSMDFEPRLKRLARDEIEFLEWLLSQADETSTTPPWVLATERPPSLGQWVEIGRIPRGSDDVQPLDKVWWHPMNWNLEGMWWRNAE